MPPCRAAWFFILANGPPPSVLHFQVELGYERVKVGPTSNFVGNHMTQGAIDLVQAQLELGRRTALLKLGLGDETQPQLLQIAALNAQQSPEAPVYQPIHQYQWSDAGNKVQLEIPVQQLELGDRSCTVLTCKFTASVLDMQLAVHSKDCITPASRWFRLLANPLHAGVLPHRCQCYVPGMPALPSLPGSDNMTAAVMPECSAASHDINNGTALEQPTSHEHVISFALPKAACSVVVQLVKEDSARCWEALQGSSQSLPKQASSSKPGLTELR
jgi:hypothetical protein